MKGGEALATNSFCDSSPHFPGFVVPMRRLRPAFAVIYAENKISTIDSIFPKTAEFKFAYYTPQGHS